MASRCLIVLISLVLCSLEANANLSFVYPKLIGLNPASPFASATTRNARHAKSQTSQPVDVSLAERLERTGWPGHVIDHFEGNVKIYIPQVQLAIIGALTAICVLLFLRSDCKRCWEPLRVIREVCYIVIAFSTMSIAASIYLATKPIMTSTPDTLFANGTLLILYSLATELIISALTTRFSVKTSFQTLIATSLIAFASGIFTNDRDSSVIATLTHLYTVQSKLPAENENLLPLLLGQSVFFTSIQTFLILGEFNSDSITAIGAACVLQVLIGGLFILTTVQVTASPQVQTFFAFFFALVVIIFALAPKLMNSSDEAARAHVCEDNGPKVTFNEMILEWRYNRAKVVRLKTSSTTPTC